jgi:hypothetical protein
MFTGMTALIFALCGQAEARSAQPRPRHSVTLVQAQARIVRYEHIDFAHAPPPKRSAVQNEPRRLIEFQ